MWFKPIRWGLCNGDGVNDYKGRMFQGWMGSNCFLSLVSNRVPPVTNKEVFKAISIVQYPPTADSDPEVLAQGTMYPAVQVLWVKEGTQMRFFVRLHPNIRFKDSHLLLDGTKSDVHPFKSRRGWGV